jgi:putative copper export protein
VTPDSLCWLAHALALPCVLQASGLGLYCRAYGAQLRHSLPAARRLGWWLAVTACVLVLIGQLLEPARLADDYSAWHDAALLRLAWTDSGGQAALSRLAGAALLAAGFSRRAATARWLAPAGAALAWLSFVLTGHTSVHAQRAVLAPLLLVHVGIVAYWLGALVPLLLAVRHEPPAAAARLLARFSALAGWLVPLIAVAGLGLALLLCPDLTVLQRPYGRLLAAKLLVYALLLVLAASNRWRYTPLLAMGQRGAQAALQRNLLAEYLLIGVVLALTASLTAWYGPEA